MGDSESNFVNDLVYSPDTAGWWRTGRRLGVGRALLVGVKADDNLGIELRSAKPPPLGIPGGAYFFKTEEGWAALLLAAGIYAAEWSGRLDRTEDSHPAVTAWTWFPILWANAEPVGPKPLFEPGTVVRVVGSGEIGQVVGPVTWSEAQYLYRVLVGVQTKLFSESSLVPVDLESDDPLTWIAEQPASGDDTALRISYFKMTSGFTDTIYSFGASKTVFRSYQFKPVLRLKDSAHKRLLIADEVGLGKTIEAGLVWTELEHRASMTRVLVVCPSMLVAKWRDEMGRRFGRSLRALDKVGLDDLVALFERGDDTTPFYGVVSLERLRASDQLERLQLSHPTFDLVIVDEAHYLRNPDTASHDVGQLLADWADALIFLSATPLNLGQRDLFTLINLLQPAEFSDEAVFRQQLAPNAYLTAAGRTLARSPGDTRVALAELGHIAALPFGRPLVMRPEFARMTEMLARGTLSAADLAECKRHLASLHTLSGVVSRTRKVDVPEDKAVREPRKVEVQWSDDERLFYQTVRAWAMKKAKQKGAPPGFYLQMPLRQSASCIPAMIDRLGDPTLDEDDETFYDLEWEEEVDDPRMAEELLDELRSMASRINHDTKFDAFWSALEDARASGIKQFMVFSFFRRTLSYLAARLCTHYKVAVMHGGVPVDERERMMASFRAGGIEILLLSEVGSEGLDFEFCNAMFNYDLPWNPMRVEQRIGRLDRFGQKHEKIFIFNFEVPGTIETDIFSRLYDRLRVFEESIGELEPILRDEINDLQKVVLDPSLSEPQRELRIRELDVAFENKSREIEDLRASEGELMGVDGLLIDGLEWDLERGRYVGPSEVRQVLTTMLSDLPGCSLKVADDGLTGTLVGTADLSRAMHRTQRSPGSSMHSLTELAKRFSDSEPIDVTFDSAVASSEGLELLTSTHPLVRTALEHLRESSRLGLARFGRVRFDGCPPGAYCVVIYVLEMTGLRPVKRLWPVAVDASSGDVRDDVGDAFLTAVARGSVRSTTANLPARLDKLVLRARDHAVSEMEKIKKQHERDNELILESRLTAVRAEVDHKIRRTRATLAKVADSTARRIYLGRLGRLEADLEQRTAELQSKKGVAASLRQVSVVVVKGGR